MLICYDFAGTEMEGGNMGRSYSGEGTVSGIDDNQEEAMKVTRKIMIVKPPGYNQGAGSAPASPAGSTPPQSPFSGELFCFFLSILNLLDYPLFFMREVCVNA